MKKEGYLAVVNYLKKHEKLKKSLIFVQKAAEILIYLAYPAFLLWLFLTKNDFYIRSAITCAAGFVLASVLRKVLDFPRPYAKFGYTHLIKKETEGNSMPSRHCFSASVIAVNIMAVCPIVGAVIALLAFIIAGLRVALGVHFIRDVAVGLAVGFAVGATVFI